MTNSVHSDVMSTFRVSSRRFETSPFHSCYVNDQTVMGVYAGRYYPVNNGEDVAAGYHALRYTCALYDVPERPVQIDGPDAVPFLEKIFARRIGDLKTGRGRYAIACTPDGGTFMDGILFRQSETRFWYVQPDGPLEAWLAAHKAGFDVTVSDPRSWVLQMQGPTSLAVMSDLTGRASDGMKYFHSGFADIGDQRLFISRTGWTSELGFEIYTDGANTDCPKLFADIMAAGEAHGLIFGSISSMEIRRIEAGILDNLTDFDSRMSPFAAGLGPFIDLDKEGFIGREALLKISDRRPCLFGLTAGEATPRYHGAVLRDGQPLGFVTAATRSPMLGQSIAYVRFEKTGDWAGQRLSVETDGGGEAPCNIVELPFFDKQKRIPRGLPLQ